MQGGGGELSSPQATGLLMKLLPIFIDFGPFFRWV